MPSQLTLITASEGTWYPVPIHKLDELLIKVIRSGRGYRHTKELRKNLAYNLQYVEFLDRAQQDLKLSSVIIKQNWKTFVIIGCSIVESLLHFLLIAKKKHSTTEWELKLVAPGNGKNWDDSRIKVDSYVYEKLSTAKRTQMTFDSMLKKAESHHILGSNHEIYSQLNHLRPLRNRIHLQEIGGVSDTDWHAFSNSDACCMANVLQLIFTSNIFRPTTEQVEYFDYLKKYNP